MRNPCWLAVALGFAVGGSCAEDLDPCPIGWTPDGASCREPEGLASSLTAEHGSGAYGLTRRVVPCAACAGECPIEVAAGLEVRAFAAEDVRALEAGGCERPFERIGGALPIATAVSSDDGAYVLPLAAGRYALTSVSPNDGCDHLAAVVRIPDVGFVLVEFSFEHF